VSDGKPVGPYHHTMRLLFCCCILAFCLAAGGDDAIVRQVTDLNALLQSATQHYDVATVSKMLTDDYVLVNNKGSLFNREATLKDIGDRSAIWIANEPSDVSVRTYNGDCAIVVALLHIKYKTQAGRLRDVIVRYTDVWVKQGANWKYASAQASVYKNLAG
jgi:ketosteroid isomerase-like protein